MAKGIQKLKLNPNEKMWACGEWLERFLNGPLRPSDFRELAEEAIRILELEFDLSEDETSLKFIEKMESLADPEKPFFEQWDYILTLIPPMSFHKANEMILFENGGELELKTLADIQTTDISMEMGPLTATLEGIKAALKALQDNPEPWDAALPGILEKEPHTIQMRAFELNVIGGSFLIVSGYRIEKGRVKRINTFQPPSDDPRPLFRWNTALARIFLTFLELGGKDYFIFCERCGRFAVVQRKGRKRFCSDICRVYEHQKKTGTGAKILHPVVPGGRRAKNSE